MHGFKYSGCVFGYEVSHRVAFAGLELEVVCFVKHWILLHEQLLVELLYYLRERQEETVDLVHLHVSFLLQKTCQYWKTLQPQ